RAARASLQGAARRVRRVASVDPFPHVARQVERSVGGRAAGIVPDPLGVARVQDAARPFALPRPVVGARAVGAWSPGKTAAVGAAGGFFPLELGGEALADEHAIALGFIEGDAGLGPRRV